jgi:hypothetical protein
MAYMKNLQALLNNWIRNDIVYSVNDVQIGVQISKRMRIPIADWNAGTVLLPAIPSFGYRLLDAQAIAIGAAVAGATTLDIVGVFNGATRKLLAIAIAALTQSAVVRAGAANATVLADGASYTRNDINTAITASVTGAVITGATFVDVTLEYTVEHE